MLYFPTTPETGDTHQVGLNTWEWTGRAWMLRPRGSSAPAMIDVIDTDIDTLVTDGHYFTEITCTHSPAAGVQYYLMVQKYPGGSGYVQQTAWDLTPAGGVWTRGQLAGNWSPWVALVNTKTRCISFDVSSTDLNSLLVPGFYDGAALTNSPDGGTDWWYVLVQSYHSNPAFTSQTAWGLNTNNAGVMYIRNNINGTWRPWSQVITSGIVPFTHRNIIGRCGGFEVWQRGTPVSIPASSTLYSVDGWYCWNNVNQACTVTRVAGLTQNSRFAAKFQRNAGQTGTGQAAAFACPLDSDEVVKCLGNNLALSFTVKAGANFSTSASVLGVYMSCGTGASPSKRGNSGYAGETAPLGTGLVINTAATRYVIYSNNPVPLNVTQMEVMFYVQPTGTAGADDSFTIDDVQLEVVQLGGRATLFERPDYASELMKCQRHLVWFSNHYLGLALNGSALYNGTLKFPVPMRAAPVLLPGAAFTSNSGGPGTVAVRVGPTVDMVGLQNTGTAWTATADISVSAGFSSEI
jgi:hypothetical protein